MKYRYHYLTLITFIIVIFSPGNVLLSLDDAVRLREFNLEGGIAIQGYDPVSYFTENKAVKGNPNIIFTYGSVKYYFSTKANRELFKKSPEKYEPQYGGWCAFAMGDDGSKVEINPETFKIIDGKLYLFYNFYFINTLNQWNEDEARLKKRADQFWAREIAN
jgi:YHS domain-containing protein